MLRQERKKKEILQNQHLNELKTEKQKSASRAPNTDTQTLRTKTRVKVKQKPRQKSKSRPNTLRIRTQPKTRSILPQQHQEQSHQSRTLRVKLKQPTSQDFANTAQNIEYFSNLALIENSPEKIDQIDKDIIDLSLSSASSSLLSLRSSSFNSSTEDEINLKHGLIPSSKFRRLKLRKKTSQVQTEEVKSQQNIKALVEEIKVESQKIVLESSTKSKIRQKIKISHPPKRLSLYPPAHPPALPVDSSLQQRNNLVSPPNLNVSTLSFTSKINIPLVQPPPPLSPPPALDRSIIDIDNSCLRSDPNRTFSNQTQSLSFDIKASTSKNTRSSDHDTFALDQSTCLRSGLNQDTLDDLDQTLTSKRDQTYKNSSSFLGYFLNSSQISNIKQGRSDKNETVFSVSHESNDGTKKMMRKIKVSNSVIKTGKSDRLNSKIEYEKETRDENFQRNYHDSNSNINGKKVAQHSSSEIKSPVMHTSTPCMVGNQSFNGSMSTTTLMSNARTKPKTSKEILQEIARLTNGTTPNLKNSSSTVNTIQLSRSKTFFQKSQVSTTSRRN